MRSRWIQTCCRPRSRPYHALQTLQVMPLASSRRTCRRFYSVTIPRTSAQNAPFSVLLTHRGLVAVVGPDAAKFLQGLTTNNIPFDPPAESPELPVAQCNAFLNAQGRILQDVLIYTLSPKSQLIQTLEIEDRKASSASDHPSFLIEADQAQIPSLMQTLKRYKLRSKIALRAVDAQKIGIFFHSGSAAASDSPILDIVRRQKLFCARDERAPGLGCRILAPPDQLTAIDTGQSGTIDDYRVHRYLQGVPEGQDELPPEHAMVQESNLDLMSGVDFRKGCYVGQELVIRTQHTGVVRKRVLPVLLYDSDTSPPEQLPETVDPGARASIQFGTDIKPINEGATTGRPSRSAGKIIANVGNLGLALARLEAIAGIGPTGEPIEGWHKRELVLDTGTGDDGGSRVKAFVPNWWASRKSE